MYKYNTWILLNESLKSARDTYLETGLVTPEEFEEIKAIDPSKTFKYIDAMLNFYVEGHIDSIDALKNDIKNFHNFSERGLIKNKDINALEYLDFKSEIRDAQSKMKTKESQKNKESDVVIVKDDEKFLIVIPNTYEASCKYGQGTKWCTSSKNEPWHFPNYRYLNKLTLYYIYNKRLPETNPMYKTSVVVDQWNNINECYDARDEFIMIEDILKMGINRSIFKYVAPVLPKDTIKAFELVGIRPLPKVKFAKILKDVSEFFGNKSIHDWYIVDHDGRLDIAQVVKPAHAMGGAPNYLIGWYSDDVTKMSLWEKLYNSTLKNDIIEYSKNYKISDELSKIIGV